MSAGLDGDGIDGGGPAAWQVPVVGHHGLIYLFNCQAWYTVSADGGGTWQTPQSMRFEDGGKVMLQPVQEWAGLKPQRIRA